MKTIYEYTHLHEDEHYFKGHERSHKACFAKFSNIFIYQPILRTFLLNTNIMKMHIFHKMKYDFFAMERLCGFLTFRFTDLMDNFCPGFMLLFNLAKMK